MTELVHRITAALRLTLSVALALLLVLAWSGPVDAAEPPVPPGSNSSSSAISSSVVHHTVLILPLETEGLHPTDRAKFDDHLRLAFEHPEITLLGRDPASPLDTDDAAAPSSSASQARCTDESCLRAIGREHQASHVILATVVADGRDYIARIVVVTVGGDAPANIIDASCDICGLSEFKDRLAARAVAARDLILAVPQIGQLEVVGQPESARVRIDGRPRGHLPFHGALSVGAHELIVSADGHDRQLVPIEMVAGVAQRVEIDLEPKPVLLRRRALGWSLFGGGLASLTTGVALIGVHGSPAALRCASSDVALVDADGDCRWLRRTLGPGVALTLVGVAASTAGVSLLVIDARRRRAHQDRDDRLAPRVSARAGWDHVELQIRF